MPDSELEKLQKQVTELKKDVDGKVSSNDFDKKWDDRKNATDDDDKKKKVKQWFDEWVEYKPTERTGQKSELNGAKEEANGANIAFNGFEMGASAVKVDMKPLLDLSDGPNKLIGKIQDRLGLPNPERIAEERLVRMETSIGRFQSAIIRLNTEFPPTKQAANNAHKRIDRLQTQLRSQGSSSAQRQRINNSVPAGRATQAAAVSDISSAAREIQKLDARLSRLITALG
ncbi:hypothetical protein [Streptomyces abikoensis]|uniref:hypothetical protein n=1 Tax=Streptomyces abikoensis TaxID=97398 RepID=UPI00167C021B|nr:hypothetical protein [Streptomyces abikoensis]GGP74630.1 hypothetical protein GCM10010214_57120 [Streptomyces abikoensis]